MALSCKSLPCRSTLAPSRVRPFMACRRLACPPAALDRANGIGQDFSQAIAVGLSALVLLTSPSSALAAQPPIVGPARAVDGDTLVINGTRIRLYGIDAPESAQQCVDPQGKSYACGLNSKDALAKKIGSSPVQCEVKNTDQYGRSVSVCRLASLTGPEDLNAWLVDNGYAVAYRQYGKDYIPLEDQAKAAKKGIWAGTFQMPSEWRKQNKRGEGSVGPAVAAAPVAAMGPVAPAVACPGGALPIKGNITNSNEKVYHKPGGRYYDAVRIDLPDGERYFCSEAEAQAAGWRASKQ